MDLPDKRELPPVTLSYYAADGERVVDTFDQEDLDRCVHCNRNTPKAHMRSHMAWAHG